jgi:hypothetical protein
MQAQNKRIAKRLPEGSEERKMNNLSLARIMYGTAEDFHATIPLYQSAIPSRALATLDAHSDTFSTHDALTSFLHKLWARIKS